MFLIIKNKKYDIQCLRRQPEKGREQSSDNSRRMYRNVLYRGYVVRYDGNFIYLLKKSMSDYNRCDVCKIENDNVKAGRWIFYCPLHEETDTQKTIENERPFDGDMNDVEGEILEMLTF